MTNLISSIDWAFFGASMDTLYYVIRILVAGICGFCIGYERKTRSKEAGIRTHTIVCMASALLMIISKYAFVDQLDWGTKGADTARIAAQIVSGIGFLGAGIIIYRRDTLYGLTTAAGIWAAAGIGMALGAGMYILGVATTVLLIILQVFLHAPIKAFKGRLYITLRATIIIKDDTVIQQMRDLFNINKFTKFKTVRNENVMTADVEFATNRAYSPEELYNIIQEYDFIKTLEKHEEI